ncbi:hypothetical protein PENTCL1PPCAC_13518 [Pristionchus entomophagus]|uniref:NadR/Ttd14 AAA domain-containing protein n=1 Tax=Pristionchus entomophagus TaxID=358040 RepID=A0AAV5TB73_9BILA|nr:hypothetical protein PENTCL1PPCAC_13518 [Pristionchus entomophagus]
MQIRARRNSYGKKVVKVVFSGGPCSGKSSSVAHVKERIQEKYGDQWKCYTVAEAASVLNSTSRVSAAELIGPCLKHWQRDMLECVRMFEKVYDDLASMEPARHTIIFCDGATLDAKVSTPRLMWPQIMDEMGTSERQLMASYDLVLVLHTAPNISETNSI